MAHIRAHYPFRTISDVCAIPEHHCNQVHPFSITMIPKSFFIYQQVNVPYHTCRILRKLFELHSNEFQVMS